MYDELPQGSRHDWIWSRQPTVHMCRACQADHAENVAAIRYQLGSWAEAAPIHINEEWKKHGWLLWWQCPACNETEYEAVTQQDILDYGRKLGGWDTVTAQEDSFIIAEDATVED